MLCCGGLCHGGSRWGGLAGSTVLVVGLFVSSGAMPVVAARCQTANFLVTASTRSMASRVAEAAEAHRRELAVRWLGREMPRWSAPCRILVRPDHARASGATTFSFRRGQVFDWQMTLQGPDEEVLESILPHELTHTVLACRFRRPVSRWADEGAAVLAESLVERQRQHRALLRLFEAGRWIPLRTLLSLSEYPSDRGAMLALYAEGVSLVSYLVQRMGRIRFLAFLEDAGRRDWDAAVWSHCGGVSIEELERAWMAWAVRSPQVLVSGWRGRPVGKGSAETIIRAQSPRPTVGAHVISPGQENRLGGKWRAPDPRAMIRPHRARLVRRLPAAFSRVE